MRLLLLHKRIAPKFSQTNPNYSLIPLHGLNARRSLAHNSCAHFLLSLELSLELSRLSAIPLCAAAPQPSTVVRVPLTRVAREAKEIATRVRATKVLTFQSKKIKSRGVSSRSFPLPRASSRFLGPHRPAIAHRATQKAPRPKCLSRAKTPTRALSVWPPARRVSGSLHALQFHFRLHFHFRSWRFSLSLSQLAFSTFVDFHFVRSPSLWQPSLWLG